MFCLGDYSIALNEGHVMVLRGFGGGFERDKKFSEWRKGWEGYNLGGLRSRRRMKVWQKTESDEKFTCASYKKKNISSLFFL